MILRFGANAVAKIAILMGALCGAATHAMENPAVEKRLVENATAGTVQIRRTAYGIPHIKADTERGLGYGIGYAYAQDNGCLLAQEIITVRGERSRYFGGDAQAGNGMQNLESDFFYRWLNSDAALDAFWTQQSPPIRDLVQGYAAGFDRWRGEQTAAAPADQCWTQPWARAVTQRDIIALMRRLMVHAGSGQFARAIVAAQPPKQAADAAGKGNGHPAASVRTSSAVAQAMPDWQVFHSRYGSNGLAVGKDLSANGRGLLLGNPHFPWSGPLRFYQMQLTIPGRLDVMGASLPGLPVVNIGFNRQIAWTHTVDTARHFTLFRLQLDPADPTRYVVDGQSTPFKQEQVSVQVAREGKLETRTRTFYESRYGPVLTVPGKLDWDKRSAYALRDANLDNGRALQQWYDMNRASTLAELRDSLTKTLGIPWVNTLAVDARGQTFFGTLSVVPNVDDDKLRHCGLGPSADGPFVLLDGSRGECDWDVDPAAPQPGVFPANKLPAFMRDDFVQNSNDSAWMVNPAAPQTGYPRIVGKQASELNPRTRFALDWLARYDAGAKRKTSNRIAAEDLRGLITGNKVYLASVAADSLNTLCQGKRAAAADASPKANADANSDTALLDAACLSLRSWDRTANTGSNLGYLYFAAAMEQVRNMPKAWTVPFDAARPVDTPAGLNTADPDVARALRLSLVATARRIHQAEMGPDTRWGDVQVATRAGQSIPIPGGSGLLGVYNAIQSQPASSNDANGKREVAYGSSYIQVVSYTGDGPKADTLLTFSESSNAGSPHSFDQTLLFSRKQWVSMPYTEAQIVADPRYRLIILHMQ